MEPLFTDAESFDGYDIPHHRAIRNFDLAISIVYGAEYAPAAVPMKIYAWSTAFSYLGVSRTIWMQCNNKTKYEVHIALFGAITSVVLNFLLIRSFGIISKGEVEERAKELLRQVDLPVEFVNRYPHSMSGGQRQRVAIARALALEPEVIVCDEATSALDVSVQDSIIKLLVKLQQEKGITYIFICHDLALVSLFSHKVVVMQKGTVMEQLDGDKLAESTHPYTRDLLNAVFSVH